MSKYRRQIKNVTEKYFPDFHMEVAKTSHINVILNHGGATRKIVACSTPSCRHSIKAYERDLKKIRKEVDADDLTYWKMAD